MEDIQQTPKYAISQAPQYYDSGIPIYPNITPQPQSKPVIPTSPFLSPTKDQRQKEIKETLEQCPQENSSYFLQRSHQKADGPVPDYAKFLTEAPISAGHIEQPEFIPPVFVPAYPPQSAYTSGQQIRNDHYVSIGQAPVRTSPYKKQF